MKALVKRAGTTIRRHKTPITVIAVIGAVLEIVRLFVGCTTEPRVDVNVEKGAVRVDPPEINAPITVVLEQCDGGYRILAGTGVDGGLL